MAKIFDDPDTWFKGTPPKTKKSKGSCGGFTGRSYRKNSTSKKANNHSINNNVKNAMNSMSGKKKIPQVLVKISGSSKGADKAQAHINYIGRKGEVEIEDEQGRKYGGDEQKKLLKVWEAIGMHAKAETGKRKEAFHFVFSMPNGTNPDGLKTAVKNLVAEEFDGHKYFIAQHLDTDSPHCHVLVSAVDDRGARLNPRKADLHNYRVNFVQKLAEQGIEATATRRLHRFNSKDTKRQGVYHRDKRQNHQNNKRPTSSQKRKILDTHKMVLSQYKDYAKSPKLTIEERQAVKKMINKREKEQGRGR